MALECEPAKRSGFIAEACNGDGALQREVESLIAAHEQSEGFIETPAADLAADLLNVSQSKLEVGEQISYYKVLGLLGRGGMGEVYLAEDTRLGRRIALKLLPAEFTIESERVRRFEQEARAASALNHPNIVTIHEIGRADSTRFIAIEFIDGATLREQMAGRAPVVNDALDVAIQIASALAAAHAAGIIHRDIKPENVMLRRDRIVKVLDFGLAKLTLDTAEAVEAEASNSMVRTNPGVVMGTVHYMSPEQARGQEVDARTDIWSLGVLLYEMITGRAPFEGETPSHTIVSILESKPPPLSLYAEVPAELQRILRKMLRKDREERYQTANDLAIDLKNLRQELEVEARLKRALQLNTGGKERAAHGGAQATLETAHEEGARAIDAAATTRQTIGAQYPTTKIKGHKRGALFAAFAVTFAIAASVYLLYLYRNGYFSAKSEAIDSVAVLPFVNASNDPNTEYLSDGISDSIIDSLSRLPNLKVISFTSVMRYKGKQIDPQAVGREMNVRAVLIGRFIQFGARLNF